MLIVNMKDGSSHTVDLANVAERDAWLQHARTSTYQQAISSLTITVNGVRYSFPRPKSQESITFDAEVVPPTGSAKGGERLVVQVGDVRITLFVHKETRAARVDVEHTGRQVYNPNRSPV